MREGFEFGRSTGLFDPYIGRSLPGLILGLGLIVEEAFTFRHEGGSPQARLLQRSMERVREMLLARKLVTRDEIEAVFGSLDDPSFAFIDALRVAVWGRRRG